MFEFYLYFIINYGEYRMLFSEGVGAIDINRKGLGASRKDFSAEILKNR